MLMWVRRAPHRLSSSVVRVHPPRWCECHRYATRSREHPSHTKPGRSSRGGGTRPGGRSARGARRAQEQREDALAPSGVLVVNKPVGPTSADVVRAVSRAYGRRKGVGHSGTLDPFASGVLVVCIGRNATRLMPFLQRNGDKEYVADILLGEETDTLDNTGEVVATADIPTGLRAADVSAVLENMIGTVMQTPPAYSALRVNGRKAYELARSGEAVELAPRPVELRAAEVLHVSDCGTRLTLRIRTGSGFYVRSLARDLAAALGTVGRLDALCRTENALFRIEEAVSLDAIRATHTTDRADPPPLLSPADAIRSAAAVVLCPRGLEDLSYGRCPSGLTVPVAEQHLVAPHTAGNFDPEADPSGQLVKLLVCHTGHLFS